MNRTVKPNHTYKIKFGVNQTEKINKAANKVNETPQDFIKNAVLSSANSLVNSSNVISK